jgi:uncharacterized protein (DUF427 family)
MSEHVEPKPKTVKIPGPDHPISVERNATRVVVTVAGRIVADTGKALTLREASYPPEGAHDTLRVPQVLPRDYQRS